MKPHEIREMKTEELLKQIDEENKTLVDLRFSNQLKQLTNTAKLKTVKKDIARLKTILKERELAEKKNSADVKEEIKEGDNA